MDMLSAAFAALNQIFTPPFRATLWKVLALTLAVLALLWVGLDRLAVHFLTDPSWFPYPWMLTAISVALGLGLFVGLAFIVAPASSLVAGGLSRRSRRSRGGGSLSPDGRGRALPVGRATWLAAKFALVSLAVNIAALIVFLLPASTPRLLRRQRLPARREYFELAALRFRPLEECAELRKRHALTLFLAGFFIAAFVAVPIVNLLTPLFGVAFIECGCTGSCAARGRGFCPTLRRRA